MSGRRREDVHESDRTADPHDRRRLSRLDPRRVRFLCADLRHQGHRQGVRGRGVGRRLRAVSHLGHALRRRLHLRPHRRPLGPQARADAGHSVLFDHRRRGGFLAQPDRLPDPAGPVRRRHGRRMGPRQLAGHGVDPAAVARDRVGRPAMRLSQRLSPGGDRLRAPLWPHIRRLRLRLARDVPAQRPAGLRRPVHPLGGAGVAGVRGLADRARSPTSGRRSRRTAVSSSTWSC